MHPSLNGSMAINDALFCIQRNIESQESTVLWLVLLVLWSCLHTVEESAARQHLHVCVYVCVCASINQGMFIPSTMCVPDRIKWVNSVWRNVSVRDDILIWKKKLKFSIRARLTLTKVEVALDLFFPVCQFYLILRTVITQEKKPLNFFLSFHLPSSSLPLSVSYGAHIFSISLHIRDLVWSQSVDKHTLSRTGVLSKLNNQPGKPDYRARKKGLTSAVPVNQHSQPNRHISHCQPNSVSLPLSQHSYFYIIFYMFPRMC